MKTVMVAEALRWGVSSPVKARQLAAQKGELNPNLLHHLEWAMAALAVFWCTSRTSHLPDGNIFELRWQDKIGLSLNTSIIDCVIIVLMIKIEQPVSAIVCAYNEAKNIGRVLKILSGVDWIDEIVVVDDCSIDDTAEQAEKFAKVHLVHHDKNQGKGGAIATGIKVAAHELLLFLDADLIGLTEKHLKQMLSPVVFTGEAKMTLGVFGKGDITATNLANRIIPGISGQRVVEKKNLPPAETFKTKRYGVDIHLTRHLPEEEIIVVELDGLSQVTKEDKEKFFDAMKSRVKMYKDIYTTLKEEKEREGNDVSTPLEDTRGKLHDTD